MSIRLITYNIQHCRDYIKSTRENKEYIDFDLIADAIKSQNADVVVLNEVRDRGTHPDYKAQAQILAEKAGFKHYFFGEAIRFAMMLPYGNAILSKYPVLKNEVIKIPDPLVKDEDAYYETRCIIRSEICVKDKEITVFGTHIGLAKKEKENAVKTLTNLIDKCKTPFVLMGDFNMEPHNEILRPIYERMNDSGDFFGNSKLSFPSDKPDIKIDYIFVSKDIEVIYSDIPDIVAADHRMHICDIKV